MRHSHPVVAALVLFVALPFSFAPAQAITIDTVQVGDPGNSPISATSGLGGVDYQYNIGKYDVTNAQYAAFLNAKAASDPLLLYDSNMNLYPAGGITQTGGSGSFVYTVKPNMADKPVNFVNLYDTLRFTNWLSNGQGNGSTETGSYTLLGGTAVPSNALSITRNAGATWVLPSENEWYKAAFYDPRTTAQGGPSADSHYWGHATMSNSTPTFATANSVGDISNPGANVENLGFANWNNSTGFSGNVTTVGSAGPLSASYYGTFDQGGNVMQWNLHSLETYVINVNNQPVVFGHIGGLRGVSFDGFLNSLYGPFDYRRDDFILQQYAYTPADSATQDGIGFRAAQIPEPSSGVLAVLGFIGVAALRLRRGRVLARSASR